MSKETGEVLLKQKAADWCFRIYVSIKAEAGGETEWSCLLF